MNRLILTAVAFSTMTLASLSLAQSEAAQTAQNLCAGCHGPNGMSVNPLWPNLAGQKAEYTAKQLRDYRSGARVDPLMTAFSQSLSDAQIIGLAEYYAKQP